MNRQLQWVELDRIRRVFFLKAELKRIIYNNLSEVSELTLVKRRLASYFLAQLPRYATPSILNARCIISGRRRGLKSAFGLSRFVFRKKVANGVIPTLRRASW